MQKPTPFSAQNQGKSAEFSAFQANPKAHFNPKDKKNQCLFGGERSSCWEKKVSIWVEKGLGRGEKSL